MQYFSARLALLMGCAPFAAQAAEPVLVPEITPMTATAGSPTPLAAPAVQQTFVAPPTQIVPIAETPTENAVLRAGTPIALRLLEEITTKEKAARVGQRIQLEVAASVDVNGVTVIPAGTPAWGEITGVRNKGMWGKSGKLDARLLYMRVNGRQVRDGYVRR